ncbi:dGTPase [Enterovibrio nigricans]|uniref:Probable deoxyguanosinetriphosphate triphosphohydrolase n=1 Tax=Enterovibrio nigricans DSM 22720 TaxID=1121868 RepID=A0A1T4V6G7_9GAMM|nr:dGTPase [Enterovibrio nigricans]PKF50105.1 dGTPase [Enterovibrio nigricans]SKA60560.1 dGTPase [Enterovibrio nigricans DSM 22720]
MSKIDFGTKISAARPYSKHTSRDNIQRAFESDRGRIINSAPIRRLQQKTQVFPLERNSAVRSRLTHSMEVQQVGRFIVHSIYEKLARSPSYCGLDGLERSVESLVEIACLMHDMGNPPFGHCGEDAINRWFASHLDTLSPMQTLTKYGVNAETAAVRQELCHFDGNAQAIRLIHSLHRFNLTYSQAASVLKYTRPGTESKEDTPSNKSYLTKKVGYYLTEKSYISELMNEMGMEKYCRHPLSYIMEAADDISYCLADIEDAVEKRILSLEKLTELLTETFRVIEPKNRPIYRTKTFEQSLNEVYQQSQTDEISKPHRFFIKLRVAMVHPLVSHAAKQFTDNLDAVFCGEFNRALLEDSSQYHAIAKTFKQVAIEHVFNDAEVETLELQGYKIIGGLLDEYRPLLELAKDDFANIVNGEGRYYPVERRLFNKLSQKHVAAYRLELKQSSQVEDPDLWEFYLRCRLLQDYISGMTDQFAFDEYKSLMVTE